MKWLRNLFIKKKLPPAHIQQKIKEMETMNDLEFIKAFIEVSPFIIPRIK